MKSDKNKLWGKKCRNTDRLVTGNMTTTGYRKVSNVNKTDLVQAEIILGNDELKNFKNILRLDFLRKLFKFTASRNCNNIGTNFPTETGK